MWQNNLRLSNDRLFWKALSMSYDIVVVSNDHCYYSICLNIWRRNRSVSLVFCFWPRGASVALRGSRRLFLALSLNCLCYLAPVGCAWHRIRPTSPIHSGIISWHIAANEVAVPLQVEICRAICSDMEVVIACINYPVCIFFSSPISISLSLYNLKCSLLATSIQIWKSECYTYN